MKPKVQSGWASVEETKDRKGATTEGLSGPDLNGIEGQNQTGGTCDAAELWDALPSVF